MKPKKEIDFLVNKMIFSIFCAEREHDTFFFSAGKFVMCFSTFQFQSENVHEPYIIAL